MTSKQAAASTSPLNRGLSRVLRARAGKKNLNQSDIARRMGIVPSQVNHWWNEDRPMSAETMVRIAQALEVDPAVFLNEARAEAQEIELEEARALLAPSGGAPAQSSASLPSDGQSGEQLTAGDRLRMQGPKVAPRTGHSASSRGKRRNESS